MGWAYIGITGALIVAVPVLMRTAAPSYGLTVIWALVGIIIANGMAIWTVSALAVFGIVILFGLIVTTRRSAAPIS
jgi:hypothetical protein